jgi:F0F1-type ATP synthase membrane subunit b/b'
MESLVAPSINLLILLSAMVYYLRAPLRQFVATRHTVLKDDLQRVRSLLQRAHEEYEEFSSKLKAVEAEVGALREQARRDAQTMKARITADAQRLSANIVSDSRATAQHMFTDLKQKLTVEIGTAVLDRAEALMRAQLTGDDRVRMREEFSRQVESSK